MRERPIQELKSELAKALGLDTEWSKPTGPEPPRPDDLERARKIAAELQEHLEAWILLVCRDPTEAELKANPPPDSLAGREKRRRDEEDKDKGDGWPH